MEVIGTIGNILLALCAIPATALTIARGECRLDTSFLTLWTLGEVMVFSYVLYLANYPLLLNYSVNTLCCLIMCGYKLKGSLK